MKKEPRVYIDAADNIESACQKAAAKVIKNSLGNRVCLTAEIILKARGLPLQVSEAEGFCLMDMYHHGFAKAMSMILGGEIDIKAIEIGEDTETKAG